MSMSLSFNNVQFDVISQNSQPWVRGYQIGRALGYDKPEVSIPQLYARHSDEFTPAMTALVKLPTEGGEQETRIFSLRGCHLLAMFARTPVAKEFRRWVLDVLDRLAEEERTAQPTLTAAPITPDQQCTLQAMVKALVEKGGHYANIWSRFNNHFRIARYCQLPQSRMSEAVDYLMRLPVEPKKLPNKNATTGIAQGELVPALPDDEFFPERAAQSVRAARLALQEAFEELSGLSRAYQRKYLHQPGKAGICFQSCSAFNEQWQCAIGALNAALFTVHAMRSVDEI